MNLPRDFELRMKEMLGDEYEDFYRAYDRPNTPSLRLNPKRTTTPPASDSSLISVIGKRVEWTKLGYYYEPTDMIRPGKHPYHDAGVYYVQEASAMIPAEICPVEPNDKVLDLCAAPGGKTTQLAAALGDEGLLVANEIHPGRAAILSQNVERMGIANAVVTNHAPHELEERFPAFFDKIVVDAPCSGEGMFRKEEQALSMWSRENVALCAERQKNILESAAKMLAPDGYLTYSTCTFSPEENEGVIASFLVSHPEFELVDPSSPAVLSCIERGIVDRGEPSWISGYDIVRERLRSTLRIFPHHADGEGHFAALLHKSNDEKDAVTPKRKQKEKKKGSKRKSCDRDSNRLTSESAYEAYEAFSKDVTKQTFEGVPCLFGDQLYLCPREIADIKDGLRILRCGLHLGSVVGKDRFEPSHALALALDVTKTERTFPVDITSARAYLHGDTLPCGEERGWYIVTLDGFALGWGKASGRIMKNHYPKGLRKPQ